VPGGRLSFCRPAAAQGFHPACCINPSTWMCCILAVSGEERWGGRRPTTGNCMHIERIQVEEGFLNGLDVWPRPGLNVIIGARCTGKTSLVELIRFCLNVPGYTPESNRRSRDHAMSVLGAGQITLTLVDGARRITVTRTAAEDAPRASGPFLSPIILSQTEIETVGLQPGGRLRHLMAFWAISGPFKAPRAKQRPACVLLRWRPTQSAPTWNSCSTRSRNCHPSISSSWSLHRKSSSLRRYRRRPSSGPVSWMSCLALFQ
jgi:hypothetical protein